MNIYNNIYIYLYIIAFLVWVKLNIYFFTVIDLLWLYWDNFIGVQWCSCYTIFTMHQSEHVLLLAVIKMCVLKLIVSVMKVDNTKFAPYCDVPNLIGYCECDMCDEFYIKYI